MMPAVIKASPDFQRKWSEFLADGEGENDLPLYVALGELAQHIANLHRLQRQEELQRVFQVVEEWHLHGDAYVREAATIGLLEDLQNTNVVGENVPAALESYLLPESKRWWIKVERFWKYGEIIRDD